MRCGEALGRILDYVHGELVMHERRAMERHFEVCASCRARMEFERRLGERLQELREH
jgi:anti-sigma factor RsiW